MQIRDNIMHFTGAFTALVTPFINGQVDEDSYRKLIEWQISEGINGLVPCGTTGESATLNHKEHEKVIEICIQQAAGRVPVIAGVGSNNTTEAIRLTVFAKKAGATAALHITPYYNKPNQEGLYQHFAAIAKEVDLPIIAYNVPGRTGCNLLPATLARLANDYGNIIGVKEATADLIQVSDIIELCPKGFVVLSGDDFTVLPTLVVGGHGVISVTANIAPSIMAHLCSAYRANDLDLARKIHYELAPLNRAMFIDTNPIPVKAALVMMGLISNEFRLPLCPLNADNTAKLRAVLKDSGII